jgi:hypothetical protein
VFAGAGNAQSLTNGGFEIGDGLYTNTADNSQITTAAVGWVTSGSSPFNYAFRVKSEDVVPNPLNPAADTNAVFAGAHGGSYSFQCYGPFGNWDASGAYQVISNSVSSGQTWILSGYGYNWSGDPMTNTTVLAQQFGLIQLVFQNASGTTLGTAIDGPHLTPDITPTNQWISCSVTGTAPVGTARVVAYAMHVAFGTGNVGSIFWDDLTLANQATPVQSNSFFAVIAVGNQVCWPTTAGQSYQPQFTNSTTGPVWSNLGGEVAGDGNTNCVFDPSGKKSFYRILELQ